MELIDVVIIICTIINITGCVYQYHTYKQIQKRRNEIVEALTLTEGNY